MKDMKWVWIALAVGLGIALVLFFRKRELTAPKAAASTEILDEHVKGIKSMEKKVHVLVAKLGNKYREHLGGHYSPAVLQELEKDTQALLDEVERDMKKPHLTDKDRKELEDFKDVLQKTLERERKMTANA